MKYFAIFDKKSGMYQENLVAHRTHHEAIRSVQLAGQDPKSFLSQFPADFRLDFIGDFDPAHGVVTPASQQGPVIVDEVAALLSQYQSERAVSVQKGDSR